jgi:hypothetical protein
MGAISTGRHFLVFAMLFCLVLQASGPAPSDKGAPWMLLLLD